MEKLNYILQKEKEIICALTFKSTLGTSLLPAREAKTKSVPGRNLGDWIIFRVHLRVSSRATYLQSRIRRKDRDGETAAYKTERNKGVRAGQA